MTIERIPLTQEITTRDGTLTKDSKCVNGYFEVVAGTKAFIKRPGVIPVQLYDGTTGLPTSIPAGQAQGTFYWGGYIVVVVNNVIYAIEYGTNKLHILSPAMTGPVAECYFSGTLTGDTLFIHNQTNGYVISNSTGIPVQVTSDSIVDVSIQTGGTMYTAPTVTFSAPVSGTTATGTVNLTSGVVTSITMTNNGSGYTTTPTVTITDAAGTTTVTNTSGTNILITSTPPDAHFVGYPVSGTGIQANTVITAISGVQVTISKNTTAAVTTVSFGGTGAGFVGTPLLNGFPTTLAIVPGAVMIDQYHVIGTVDNQIHVSNLNNPAIWDPISFITKESEYDPLIAIARHMNYVIAFGLWSLDFYYDAGNTVGSPLSPALAYHSEIGCQVGTSVASFENTVVWIGSSRSSGVGVYMFNGATPTKISTSDIDRIIANSDLKSANNVRSYAFKWNGHVFYVLTLHSSNITLVYDLSEKAWYQWTTYANTGPSGTYVEQYFVPAFFVGGNELYYAVDDDSGTVYTFTDTTGTDNGVPIYYRIVTRLIDSGTTKRKFFRKLEVIGDKIPATMKIRYTENDYKTWSNYRSVNLNAERSMLNQGGMSRRRAYEFLCTDPVPLRIESAEIEFDIGEIETGGGA